MVEGGGGGVVEEGSEEERDMVGGSCDLGFVRFESVCLCHGLIDS